MKRKLIHLPLFYRLFAIFVICRLPFLILEYPGVIPGDTSASIAMFLGIPDPDSLSNIYPIGEPNNHQPIIFSYLYGSLISLGNYIGSQGLVVFLYLIIQMLFMSWIQSALFCELRPNKNQRIDVVWKSLVVFTSLYPVFGFWSSLLLKDSLYSIIFLCLFYLIILCFKRKVKFLFFYVFICSMALMLTRNQGVHILVIISIVSLFVRSVRPNLTMPLACAIVVYIGLLKTIYPLCGIHPVAPMEFHGFMFQQTALCVKTYPEDISLQEKEIIGKLLPYDSLSIKYNPDLQDPVKFCFKTTASDDDFRSFYKVYCSMMYRHPDVAIMALWNECSSFFYPSKRFPMFYPEIKMDVVQTDMIPLINPQPSGLWALMHLPIIGLLFDCGFLVPLTIVLIFTLIFFRCWNHVFWFLPVIISIFVLIISPSNGCYRYVMPIVYTLPYLIIVCIESINNHFLCVNQSD